MRAGAAAVLMPDPAAVLPPAIEPRFAVGDAVRLVDQPQCSLLRLGVAHGRNQVATVMPISDDGFYQRVHAAQGCASHTVYELRLGDGSACHACGFMLRPAPRGSF